MRFVTRSSAGLFLDLFELGLRVTMAMDSESIIGTERHRALVIARRAKGVVA